MNILINTYMNKRHIILGHLINNTNQTKENLEDLLSDVYFILLEKDIDKLNFNDNDNLVFNYILRICVYQISCKSSKYNKEYINNNISLNKEVYDDIELIDMLSYEDNNYEDIANAKEQHDKEIKRLKNKIKCYLDRMASKSAVNWYKVELFRRYFNKKMTYRDIAKDTGVPLTTVYNKVNEVLELVKAKYNKEIKNINDLIIYIGNDDTYI